MKTIDLFFKNTQKQIKEEKDRATKAKEAKRREDTRLKERLSTALKSLETVARGALESSGAFSKFMFENVIEDCFHSEKFRIVIADFKPLYQKGDRMTEEKVFRIYISFEGVKKYVDPKVFADIKNLEVSCGDWWWLGGRQHVDKQLPSRTDLLHFIESLDDLATFVEACTRTNTK